MTSTFFSDRTSYTGVPDPIFGAYLESVEDLAELKCVLRAIWLIQKRKPPTGMPQYVSLEELSTDPVIANHMTREDVSQIFDLIVGKGILAKAKARSGDQRVSIYVLNRQKDRRALEYSIANGLKIPEGIVQFADDPKPSLKRRNIFKLYEQHFGLTIMPALVEMLKEAENEYPEEWIVEAFKIATKSNVTRWSFVESILKRWKVEGKRDGESRGHLQKIDPDKYYQDYLKRRGELPRS